MRIGYKLPPAVGLSCPVSQYLCTVYLVNLDIYQWVSIGYKLTPAVGLYISFFPVFIYSLLNTSRHITMDENRLQTTSSSRSLMSCFPVFMYSLLGKSRHISMGEYRLQTTSSSGSLHILFPSVYLQLI